MFPILSFINKNSWQNCFDQKIKFDYLKLQITGFLSVILTAFTYLPPLAFAESEPPWARAVVTIHLSATGFFVFDYDASLCKMYAAVILSFCSLSVETYSFDHTKVSMTYILSSTSCKPEKDASLLPLCSLCTLLPTAFTGLNAVIAHLLHSDSVRLICIFQVHVAHYLVHSKCSINFSCIKDNTYAWANSSKCLSICMDYSLSDTKPCSSFSNIGSFSTSNNGQNL